MSKENADWEARQEDRPSRLGDVNSRGVPNFNGPLSPAATDRPNPIGRSDLPRRPLNGRSVAVVRHERF
ncbi:MAG: hypothetical protein AB7V39_01085, partial [Nitrospiraceae bacterium]